MPKTTITRVDGALVSDGNEGHCTIRTGGRVDFKNPRAHHRLGVLDLGPYPVSWIGQWPCGRKSLYLQTADGEPGVRAKLLKAAT